MFLSQNGPIDADFDWDVLLTWSDPKIECPTNVTNLVFPKDFQEEFPRTGMRHCRLIHRADLGSKTVVLQMEIRRFKVDRMRRG